MSKTDQLDDAQVLAELRDEERDWFQIAVDTVEDDPLADTLVYLRRLALARIEAREAAARERLAIAAMLADHARALQERTGVQTEGARSTLGSYLADEIDALIVRILARGGAA